METPPSPPPRRSPFAVAADDHAESGPAGSAQAVTPSTAPEVTAPEVTAYSGGNSESSAEVVPPPADQVPQQPLEHGREAAVTPAENLVPADLPAMSADAENAVAALLSYIADDECSEVLLNGPAECTRKIRGARYHCPEVVFDDAKTYHDALNTYLLAHVDTKDRIDGANVLIEGQLTLDGGDGREPMMARVHMVAPPGVKYAKVTIAKKPRRDLTLMDMVDNGTMTRNMAEFLQSVAEGRATFVVSGPTGAGKSTLLQAISRHFDSNDRVVVIEETPELTLPLGDVVYLRATLEKPGMPIDQVFTLEFWAKQANRMRMDRVVVGETRGSEMAEWLVAANSGAEGSATTLHAESPRRALDKMLALASRAPWATSESQLRKEIAATVDVIIQMSLVDGRHVVTGIEEINNTVTQQTAQIQSTPLFTYDRHTNQHVVKGRPSDDFIARMGSRGVGMQASWFRAS